MSSRFRRNKKRLLLSRIRELENQLRDKEKTHSNTLKELIGENPINCKVSRTPADPTLRNIEVVVSIRPFVVNRSIIGEGKYEHVKRYVTEGVNHLLTTELNRVLDVH